MKRYKNNSPFPSESMVVCPKGEYLNRDRVMDALRELNLEMVALYGVLEALGIEKDEIG